jgi:pseudoazurin
MVFEPALVHLQPGDSIHFVATDKSHNVVSNAGMLPAGAPAFEGKLNQDLTVKLDKPGVYGFNCKPHYPMGMVGVAVVGGNTSNLEAAKASMATGVPPKAKQNFTALFTQIETKK